MGKFLETRGLESVQKIKRVYHIDPAEIKYFPKMDFAIHVIDEKTSDGDWDRELMRIEDSSLYRAFEHVFLRDGTWDATEYYTDDLQKRGMLSEAHRETHKRNRCLYLNYLWKAMSQFGYVQDPFSDLVGICIGRNGEIILNNGRHRAIAARLLSIPSIPVTIDVRHKEWMKFCGFVHEYALMHRGRVYAPITHVDLKHLPARQKDRSSLIIERMSPAGGSLCDLGALWGLMCQKLEGYFDRCVAVEKDEFEAAFLKRFRDVYGCSYEIAEMDAVDFICAHPEWDCVLMMSVLHHIPIEQRDKLFNALNAKEMFFQFPSREEFEVPVAEWVRMILNTSCFSRVEQLTNTDREIFHFKR